MKTLFPFSLVLVLFLTGAACKKSGGQDDATAAGSPKELRIVPYRDGDLWGFSDPNGRILLEPKYEYAYLTEDGFGHFSDGEKMGLLAPDGKLLLEPTYNNISIFRNDRAVVWTGEEQSGYIDMNGNVVIAPVYEEAYDFQRGLAVAKKNGQYLLIKPDGSLVKNLGKLMPNIGEYDMMGPSFSSLYDPGFMTVQQPETYLNGLINDKGEIVVKPTYQYLSAPIKGVMIAMLSDTYRLIRTDGSAITPSDYTVMYPTSQGRYIAQNKRERYGVLDEKGQTLIPFEYTDISGTQDGNFIGYRDEKAVLMGPDGKVLIPAEYGSLSVEQAQGLFVAYKNDKGGVVNAQNEVIVPLEFESVQILSSNRFLVQRGEKWGLVGPKGKVILEPEYDIPVVEGEGEYGFGFDVPKTHVLLKKEGVGKIYDLDGKAISDKNWKYLSYPDNFGLTTATDANGRQTYIGPNSKIYGKDPEMKKVTVKTVQDLYKAIGSDTEITLEDGKYDLSKVTGESEFAAVFDYGFEDRTIIIRNVRNLHIKARNARKAELVVPFSYVPVIRLANGYNVSLTGLVLGHDVEPGYCDGAVITAENMNDLLIDNCDLYGSGTVGVEAEFSYDLILRKSTIRECTAGILTLKSCTGAFITQCEMKDNKGYDMVVLDYSYNITFSDVRFTNNHSDTEYGPYHFFKFPETYQPFVLNNCTFENCSTDIFASDPTMLAETNVNRKGLKLRGGK